MTEPKRHEVPSEEPLERRGRTGEGVQSILPHLQQQVQAKTPPELEAGNAGNDAEA
jgi:hypothetical protein